MRTTITLKSNDLRETLKVSENIANSPVSDSSLEQDYHATIA